MKSISAITTTGHTPGDDGDPHLVGDTPTPRQTFRFRPSLTDRFALLGGADLVVALTSTGPTLSLAPPQTALEPHPGPSPAAAT